MIVCKLQGGLAEPERFGVLDTGWLEVFRNCDALADAIRAVPAIGDNGDIGSSSKIFMQVGSAIDNRKNNKATDNESFSFYLARYRENLLVGYKIKEKIFDSYLDDEIELTIWNEKPKAKQTDDSEWVWDDPLQRDCKHR
jgi:hypothetical protein